MAARYLVRVGRCMLVVGVRCSLLCVVCWFVWCCAVIVVVCYSLCAVCCTSLPVLCVGCFFGGGVRCVAEVVRCLLLVDCWLLLDDGCCLVLLRTARSVLVAVYVFAVCRLVSTVMTVVLLM